MPEPTLDDLIQKHLDGVLSAEEFRDLERRLIANPAEADAFARACRMDNALAEQFFDERMLAASTALARQTLGDIHAADDYIPTAPRRSCYRLPFWATAAALLIAAGVGIWYARQRVEPGPLPVEIAIHRVLSGDVLVDGQRQQPIRDGSRVDVLGEAAVIALSDGSQVRLAPESTAEFRGPAGKARQVIFLSRGSGTFKVEKGNRQFRVETPVGDVTVLGTQFSVHLQPLDSFEGDDMLIRSLTLAVAVTAGQVEVQVNGRQYLLGIGQSQVFADDKPANPANFDRRADMTAKMVKYDEKANLLVVAGKENQGNVTFAIAKDAKALNEKGETKFSALAEGQVLMLYLNEDKSTILAVRVGAQAVEGGRDGDRRSELRGFIAKHDAQNNTLAVLQKTDGGDRQTNFNVSKEVKVIINGREGKVGEIAANAQAVFRLSEDRSTIVAIVVESKPDRRIIQSVDVAKKTVQFRAEGRDLIFPVADDVKVVIDGKLSKLGDIPPDSPATVFMSPDRTTVLSIQLGKGGERRPDGDKPVGERRPDGEKKPDGERRPDGEKKPDGEKPPVKKPDGEK